MWQRPFSNGDGCLCCYYLLVESVIGIDGFNTYTVHCSAEDPRTFRSLNKLLGILEKLKLCVCANGCIPPEHRVKAACLGQVHGSILLGHGGNLSIRVGDIQVDDLNVFDILPIWILLLVTIPA